MLLVCCGPRRTCNNSLSGYVASLNFFGLRFGVEEGRVYERKYVMVFELLMLILIRCWRASKICFKMFSNQPCDKMDLCIHTGLSKVLKS